MNLQFTDLLLSFWDMLQESLNTLNQKSRNRTPEAWNLATREEKIGKQRGVMLRVHSDCVINVLFSLNGSSTVNCSLDLFKNFTI